MRTIYAGPLDDLGTDVREIALGRMGQVVETLTRSPAPREPHELVNVLESLLVDHDPSRYWLTAAAVGDALPTEDEVATIVRTARHHGVWQALDPSLRQLAEKVAQEGGVRDLEVVREAITIDVHTTVGSHFTSGIQRVVRECVRRWCRRDNVRLLGWSDGLQMLRTLTAEEFTRVTLGEPVRELAPITHVIPWQATHLIPELPIPSRSPRIEALARFGGLKLGLIGYDTIPLTASGLVPDRLVSEFLRHLAASSHATRIAAISEAAADEYRGWTRMLSSRGRAAPEIKPIPLPVHGQKPSLDEFEAARLLLCVGDTPLVLVVGSHAPSKNHHEILHAAELLWREGLRFSLAFVGSSAWKAEPFYERVAELQALGRPVQAIRSLDDGQLWAAYRLAHCVVFPSLAEGFGLPVAEAMACGTPVVTSDFGSMAEIVTSNGKPLGGLLVDPRDGTSIGVAIRSLLTDVALHERLSREASSHRLGSWDEYSADLWHYLVHGEDPESIRTRRARREETEPPRLIYVHLPKCGGTSLGRWLRRTLGHDQVYDTGHNFPHELSEVAKRQFKGYRAFVAHFDLFDIDQLPDPRLAFTIFRDPVDRLVSIYDFWRAYDLDYAQQHDQIGPIAAHQMTFEQFVANESDAIRQLIDNHVTRLFARLNRTSARIDNRDEALERAIVAVSELDHVGHLGDMDETMRWLTQVLDLPANIVDSGVGRENVRGEWKASYMRNDIEKTEISAEARVLLQPLVELDQQLIEHFFPGTTQQLRP